VHPGILGRTLLALITLPVNHPKTIGFHRRQPHSKALDAMRQRCGKSVGAIDKLHGLDLLVGQFGLLGIVVWIRVNIVWSTEGSPRILGPHAVMHIEN